MSSRFLLACVFVCSMFGVASADRLRFARPPEKPTLAAPEPHLDRLALRAKLAEMRALNLARFRAYVTKGVFPNNLEDRTLNIWRDPLGHLCAAATIIHASGHEQLVASIAETDNFIRLADVTSGPLMDWILTSGFTQDELVAIQRPFRPVGDVRPDIVDPLKRTTEDARLTAKYRAIDAMIVKNAAASLDRAVELLVRRPGLARQLLDG